MEVKGAPVEQVVERHDPTQVHKAYLELLGFTDHAHLYTMQLGKAPGRDATASPHQLPTVVTGVRSSNYHNAIHLIDSVRRYLAGQQVMIFDLGLGSYDLVQVMLSID